MAKILGRGNNSSVVSKLRSQLEITEIVIWCSRIASATTHVFSASDTNLWAYSTDMKACFAKSRRRHTLQRQSTAVDLSMNIPSPFKSSAVLAALSRLNGPGPYLADGQSACEHLTTPWSYMGRPLWGTLWQSQAGGVQGQTC